MSDVPPEIIANIFSRLPVKSLLRFRCVSKLYCALIDSPDFIKSQLLKSKSNPSIVISDTLNIYSSDLDSLDKPTLLNHPFQDYHKPISSATPFEDRCNVLSSCNGLLCVLKDPQIVFRNPSTRKHHKLPVSEIDHPVNPDNMCEYVVYGFGYDDCNDDYKLVRITQFYNEVENKVKVYNLKSDSWRRLNDCPYRFATDECAPSPDDVFIDAALHWLVNQHSGIGIAQIVAFHLATEEYHVVPHPQFSNMNFLASMGKLGGRLSLHCSYYKSHVDIWVMNSYGVKESWTKLYSVAEHVNIRRFEFLTAITYSNDGKQVLLHQLGSEKLLWYDLQLKTIKVTSIPGIQLFWKALLYVESLVKLPHGADIDFKLGKKKSKKRDDFLSKGFKLVL